MGNACEAMAPLTTSALIRKTAAFWSVVPLFIYYNIDRWTPLGRWNGQYSWPVRNDQFYLDIFVDVVLLATMGSFWKGIRVGMVLGTGLLGLWVYFHLRTWWLPYMTGVHSPGAIVFYSQLLAHTQVLPTFRNHFAPDAEHTFIDVFVFPAFVLCSISTIRTLARFFHRNTLEPT